MHLHRALLTTTRTLPLASRHLPPSQRSLHNNALLPHPAWCRNLLVIKPQFPFTRNVRFQTTHQQQQSLSEYFQNIESTLYNPEIKQQRPSSLRFVPYENIFAYQLIKQNNDNNITVNPCDQDPVLKSLKELILSGELFKNNKTNEEQLDRIVERLSLVSHDEAIDLLKHLVECVPVLATEADWNRVFLSSNFTKIWKTLNDATVQLVKCDTWQRDLSKLFQIANLWFELGLNLQIDFIGTLAERIVGCDSLEWDKETLLHVMFYLNLKRSMDSMASNVIDKTDHYLATRQDLNLDDLAIIGMGFFKTKTQLPYSLLMNYLKHCQRELSLDKCEVRGTISVASILKVIRFSLSTIDFDARQIRSELRLLVEGFYRHQINLLESNICLTHLLNLLNSSFLFQKRIYKMAFDRLIDNPSGFRIKDIDKLLFCFANLQFVCRKDKLNQLEQYLEKCEESQIYPYHVYDIVLFLLTLDYFPYRLIRMCRQPEFLSKSQEVTKMPLESTLMTIESVLRLELPTQSFFTEDQITKCRSELSSSVFVNQINSKRGRFLRVFQDTLKASYGPRSRLIDLLPHSAYPFPVILNDRLMRKLETQRLVKNELNNLFHDCDPFNVDLLKSNFFKGCIALNVLMTKDFTWDGNVRGSSYLNRRLLQRLGFHVVDFQQRDLKDHISVPRSIENNVSYAQPSLMAVIENAIRSRKLDQLVKPI